MCPFPHTHTHTHTHTPAVEATLRGDEQPARVDSISVALSNSINPPPLPTTPRPPLPVPHHRVSATNGERTPHQSPTPPSSRPKAYPPHSHHSLPPPPLPTRSTSPASSSTGRTRDTPPPLPPNRPSSPTSVRDNAPPPPIRPSSRGNRPPQRPPLPQRPSVGGGLGTFVTDRERPMPPIPARAHTSPETATSPSSGPTLPPRLSSKPNPPSPPKHANMPHPRPPPPGGSRPKPRLPKKTPSFTSTSSSISPPLERISDCSVWDMIQRLQKEAPDIIPAVRGEYGTVPQLLEELASLTEGIVEAAQSWPNDASIALRMCITTLRSQVITLRGPTNDPEQTCKTINGIIKQIHNLSTHLAE